jgi:hypothetical protein
MRARAPPSLVVIHAPKIPKCDYGELSCKLFCKLLHSFKISLGTKILRMSSKINLKNRRKGNSSQQYVTSPPIVPKTLEDLSSTASKHADMMKLAFAATNSPSYAYVASRNPIYSVRCPVLPSVDFQRADSKEAPIPVASSSSHASVGSRYIRRVDSRPNDSKEDLTMILASPSSASTDRRRVRVSRGGGATLNLLIQEESLEISNFRNITNQPYQCRACCKLFDRKARLQDHLNQ